MARWLRWLAFAPIVLLLVVLGVVQVLRALAIGDEERAALALLEVPAPAVRGSNGFPALALANHEVPEGQVDAAMAAEVAAFQRWLEDASAQRLLATEANQMPQAPDASERWPERPALEFGEADCSLSAAACLAEVAAATEETRALLEREKERLARVDAALAADHFRSVFPAAPEAPLPPYQLLRLSLLRAALDSIDGRVAESLSRSCSLLSASRRFGGDATDLIGSMVFAAAAEGAANLLLDVRRAHPGVALPADCAPALAPVQSDDYVLCEAMRGEFRWGQSVARRMDGGLADSWRPADVGARLYLVDGRLMEAWTAPGFAHLCTDDYRTQLSEGIVPALDYRPITAGDPTCYGAYVSCILARIARPDYSKYQIRLLDHAAKLRLALASLALAEGAATREQALAGARSPGYTLDVDEAAGTATLALRGDPGHRMPREYTVSVAPLVMP